MWYREYFPRSRPRQAKGGIKSQSKRGTFGESWWARRWIQVLESFNIGARLGRGRSYARKGQVLSVDVDKGVVKAKVQGSRPKPYDITIKVKVLPPADWKKLARGLSEQAIFVAKLLAGEMPNEIEKVFDDQGLSLFPAKRNDLTTNCSCPDWSNPCKHIAAVYYLLGEEFDRDPFLIFKLRGLSREELMASLGESKSSKGEKATVRSNAETPAEPLPVDLAKFWSGNPLPDDFFGPVEIPPVSAAILRRLGNFPLARRAALARRMEPVYHDASRRGLEVFLGKQG